MNGPTLNLRNINSTLLLIDERSIPTSFLVYSITDTSIEHIIFRVNIIPIITTVVIRTLSLISETEDFEFQEEKRRK